MMIKYELEKIWKRKDFLLAVSALVLVNLFLLWYTNLPDETTPPLSAYKAFQKEISGMSEREKADYMEGWKETLDAMEFVQEVLFVRQLSGEMGETLLKQVLESKPGIFEQYNESFQKGDYLKFTDSFFQEKVLADELYQEWRKVSGFGDYLRSIQENSRVLGSIGIFSSQETDTFSSRNIVREREDYRRLTDSGICWMSEKPLIRGMENLWTDLLSLLSIFLFVGHLIFREKERGLFYVIRSAKHGITPCILAKLAALLIHCVMIAFLLYGTNLLFFGITAGLGSMEGFWGAPLQSIAGYMESCYSMSVGQFILLSLLTKGIALFCTASLLTVLCILADNIILPYGAAGIVCGISWALYLLFPAGTKWAVLKYCNLAGVMRTENLYGAYLNFNLFGYPVSRTGLSWGLMAFLILLGTSLCLLFFGRGENFAMCKATPMADGHSAASRHGKGYPLSMCGTAHTADGQRSVSDHGYRKNKEKGRSTKTLSLRNKTYISLLRHEWYKIMITGRALPVLAVFLVLIGYQELTREYGISAKEQYYQEIMLRLEGELTKEKEALILAEESRFQEAFDNISRIEERVSGGEISAEAGEDLKAPWYAVTAFYPSFGRVWQQYQRILERGGSFLYDTGYLYLLGVGHSNSAVNLLMLTLCSVFAFGNCLSMEYESGAWQLLNTSLQGKRKVFFRKTGLCLLVMVMASLVPFLCRAVNLSELFPMHGLEVPADNIPYYNGFPVEMPIACFLLLAVGAQSLSLAIVTLGVILLSGWRRSYVQTVFFALLLFAMPLILKLLGFEFAGWFSVHPLYSWMEGP